MTRLSSVSRGLLIQVGFCLTLVCSLFADDTSDPPKEAKPKTATKTDKPAAKGNASVVAISPERETAAIDFAKSNHPELASLLEGLKQNAPKEYRAALADLDRAVERLSKIKEKSFERYETELADWKMTSRIRLLAARLSVSDDATVEAELRSAMRERLEMRLAVQRAERDRLQSRVAKLSQTIDDTSSKADAIVEKQFADLRKTLPAKAAARNKSKKPASKTADTKNEQGEQK